jgi:general secretion pathway protein D
VNKPTALLLAGLLFLSAADAHAQGEASPAPAAPADQIDIKKLRAGGDFITLNFTNIDIAALVKVMSELTRRNFIIDDKVAGKVTLMTPTKISSEEAYQVFLSALEIKGFTAVEDGKVVRIVPTALARQSGLKVVPDGDMRGEGFVTKLIRMSFVNPQDIVRALSPLISKDGNLIAYPATNSLIVTDSVYNIRKIESLIRALDVAPAGKGKINVYYLKNANAEDISKVMSALVSRLPAPGAGAAAAAGPATILEGAVTISADKATNSLIIVGSPIDYETIKDVIQKLDIRRRQVYVEAAIIEMSLAKQRELGFEFLYTPREIQSGAGAPTTPLGGTNFGNIGNVVANGPAGLASMSGLSIGAIKGTFTYNGTQFLNIGALLHALQTDGDVNVLSTPNILTTDNQKAEIMVGENVPFVTGQSQSTATGGGSILTTVDRRDVGITLKITPQITSDDNVRLEIYQEISAVTATAGLNPNIVGPSTSKRSASTTVVVKDHETMVIGGLIRDNVTTSTSKVPLLGDIPILGWLFKSNSTKVEKTNLMIFITPYIIKNEADAGEITKLKAGAQEKFREEHRIEKKETAAPVEEQAPAAPPKETGQPAPEKNDDGPAVPAPAAPSQPGEGAP